MILRITSAGAQRAGIASCVFGRGLPAPQSALIEQKKRGLSASPSPFAARDLGQPAGHNFVLICGYDAAGDEAMKKAAALLIRARASCPAARWRKSGALRSTGSGSDIYSWDGTQLTQSGTVSIDLCTRITRDETVRGTNLSRRSRQNQSLPRTATTSRPATRNSTPAGAQLTDFLYDSWITNASGGAILYLHRRPVSAR
jgi:hypothetical protein